MLAMILIGAAATVGAAAEDSCVACHGALDGALAAPVEGMSHDVHGAHGISCVDCHGGDPADMSLSAMDETKGFKGKPEGPAIIMLCARCHADRVYMRERNPALPTDQAAQYATSVHGRRLEEGDTRVATCVSCHGAHGILSPANAASPVYPTNVARTCGHCHADQAHMAGYGIPTNQFADYQTSVHAELLFSRHDLSAPTCNDCHGNHGAYPPGASSVAGVCGQCHPINRDLFLASPHKPAFDKVGLPECVTCHGKHAIHRTSDAMLGTAPVAVCVTCHAPDSPGYRAADAMGNAVAELVRRSDEAHQAFDAAARAGMEVTEAPFQLQKAHEALVQSRNLVHGFAPQPLLDEVAKGEAAAESARADSTAALAEFRRRRRLVFIPLAAFGVVGVLLYLKLREVERERS